jgi:peptidoglycan hydrolase-like amidase
VSRLFGIIKYRLKYFFILVNTFILFVLVFNHFSLAKDDCEKITNLDEKLACYEKQKQSLTKSKNEFTGKLNEILAEKDKVNSQISNLSNQLTSTASQIKQIENTLNKISKEIEGIEKNLNDRRENLEQKINVRDAVIKSYYYSKSISDVEYLIGENSNSFSNLSIALNAQEKINSSLIDTIKILSKEITDYESDKIEAEKAKKDLETSFQNFLTIKNKLTSQQKNLSSELSELKEEQESVEDKLDDINASIKKLSDKQQAIIREKAGDGVSGSIGDYEQPDYKLPEPPFKPAFALMSYGAFTHYNGMSQYGALGRSKDGQDYKEILKFYYKVDTKKVDDFPSKISVKGVGTLDYQYYLYGIAEMPSDWPVEALKAQAIAARTYSYRASKPICITESCQVYNASKAAAVKSGKYPNWKKAVDETKGIILNNPKNSQYSSTTGGYSNDSGWDLDGGSWPGSAYEKKAGSPWFYKAWYTQGYSTSSSTCGRSTPWLSEKEMADILNSWVVWRKGSSADKDRISPVVNNCFGGNPYSTDRMKEKAEDFGESYSSVSDVDVEIGNNGRTSKVTFSTNRGRISIEGEVFKTVANLRAPGYISFKSRLWDIEIKK